jgi:hypothetical protein
MTKRNIGLRPGMLYRNYRTGKIYMLIKIERNKYWNNDPYSRYSFTFLRPDGKLVLCKSETANIEEDFYWRAIFERIDL